MKLKTILTCAVAFTVWLMIRQPHSVPHLMSDVGGFLQSAANLLGRL